MIQEFEITNFRCFKKLNLKDLATINVIVGDNGSGKTALLEALLVATYADARVAPFIRITRNRALPQGQVTWNSNLFEFMWEDLFYDFSSSRSITAKFRDTSHRDLKVEIFFEFPDYQEARAVTRPIPELVFIRYEDEPLKTRSSLQIDFQGNAVIKGSVATLPPTYLIPSTLQFNSLDMANLFSDLSKRNMEDLVIDAMKTDFPDIKNISILTDGDVSGLFVTTKSVPNTKIPLAIVSSGAARYLNMLLAVAASPKGVVLIDEIENGIYWNKMPNVWGTLRTMCNKQKVQVFVTTHSLECLEAASLAAEQSPDDFSIIRTIRNKTGAVEVQQFGGKKFVDAMEENLEIR